MSGWRSVFKKNQKLYNFDPKVDNYVHKVWIKIVGITKELESICSPFEIKSPFGDGTVQVAISPQNERIHQFLRSRRMNQIYDAFYNLYGRIPPVNNIGFYEKTPFPDEWGGIRRAHVIFKGLKRPCKSPGMDGEFYTYVTRPAFRYEDVASMVCAAKRVDVQPNLLFVVVVSFHNKDGNGEVLNWEWVECDPHDPKRPIDFATRYDQEVWNNG